MLGHLVQTPDSRLYAAVNEAALGLMWARQMSGSCPARSVCLSIFFLHTHMYLEGTWPDSRRCYPLGSLLLNS